MWKEVITVYLEECSKYLSGDLWKATKGLRVICVPAEIGTGDVLNRSWGRYSAC